MIMAPHTSHLTEDLRGHAHLILRTPVAIVVSASLIHPSPVAIIHVLVSELAIPAIFHREALLRVLVPAETSLPAHLGGESYIVTDSVV